MRLKKPRNRQLWGQKLDVQNQNWDYEVVWSKWKYEVIYRPRILSDRYYREEIQDECKEKLNLLLKKEEERLLRVSEQRRLKRILEGKPIRHYNRKEKSVSEMLTELRNRNEAKQVVEKP
jgi:hypothetical protein